MNRREAMAAVVFLCGEEADDIMYCQLYEKQVTNEDKLALLEEARYLNELGDRIHKEAGVTDGDWQRAIEWIDGR